MASLYHTFCLRPVMILKRWVSYYRTDRQKSRAEDREWKTTRTTTTTAITPKTTNKQSFRSKRLCYIISFVRNDGHIRLYDHLYILTSCLHSYGCQLTCNTLVLLRCFKLVISTDDVLQGDSYVFYVVIGIVMMLSALAPLLLRETGGQPLEDGLRGSSKGAASTLAADDEMQLQRLS